MIELMILLPRRAAIIPYEHCRKTGESKQTANNEEYKKQKTRVEEEKNCAWFTEGKGSVRARQQKPDELSNERVSFG